MSSSNGRINWRNFFNELGLVKPNLNRYEHQDPHDFEMITPVGSLVIVTEKIDGSFHTGIYRSSKTGNMKSPLTSTTSNSFARAVQIHESVEERLYEHTYPL